MRHALTVLLLLIATACAQGPTDETPVAAADEVAKPPVIAVSKAWPASFRAAGTVTQAAVGTPSTPPPVVTPASKAEIRYQWPSLKMATFYQPACPALVTAVSGSDHPCSYFFQDDDVYYVYRDQQMTAEPPDPDHDRCCVINGFSMLSPHFPEFVEQYDAYMKYEKHVSCTPSQTPERLPASAVTPGTPGAGFYAYDPHKLLTVDGQSWVTPLGFGGTTPNSAFTSVVFDQAVAFPADIAEIALPEICQVPDVPQCMQCDTDGSCAGSLTDVFQLIKSPLVAGCVLCHNTFSDSNFPSDKMNEFSGGSCGGAATTEGEGSQLVARSW